MIQINVSHSKPFYGDLIGYRVQLSLNSLKGSVDFLI